MTKTRAQKNRENGKKGGRPKGKKSKKTLEREAILRTFNERVFRSADSLFNAAKSVATGQMFVYRIDKEERGGAKNKYTIQKHVLVTDPDEINEAMDKLYGDGESEEYYYVTTKEPDTKAIDLLMNRSFGRPKETIEHQGEIKGLAGLISTLENGDRKEDN